MARFQGLGAALQESSPLLLGMAQGLRQGNPYGGIQSGLASMMEKQREREASELFGGLFGGGMTPTMSTQNMQPQGLQTPTPVSGEGQLSYGDGASPALDLIRGFEGFRETPYWDVNALRTGYGSDTMTMPDGSVVPVTDATRVTRADADRDLQRRVSTEFEPIAQRAVGAQAWGNMNPQQRAALTSIAYNYGKIPASVANAAMNGGDVGGAIRGLAGHNDGINAGRRNREADIYGGGVTMSSQGGSSGPSMDRLYAALGSGKLNPAQAAVVQSMIAQQQQANDPLRQLQMAQAQVQLAQAMQPEAPSSFRALEMQARAGGLIPGSPDYQAFMRSGGQTAPTNQAEREISLLGEIGIPRDQAIRMTQVYTVSRDPVSGQAVLLDKSTGLPVQQPAPPQAPSQPAPPSPGNPNGNPGGFTFPQVESAFGVQGAGRGVANTVADTLGLPVPYPQTQETQSDFAVLKEAIRNDLVTGYGTGKPSNWLMQQIDSLIPSAGNPLTGASGALTNLQSLQRSMESELVGARQSLQRNLTPQKMIEAEDRVMAIETALDRLTNVIGAFNQPPQQPSAPQHPGGNRTSTGVTWSIVE